MKLIKLYEEFWGRKSKSEGSDLEFDFLAAVGKMQKTILKIVEVHEKHYYSDVKISTNDIFKSELKVLFDETLNGKVHITENYLELIDKWEKELYNDNKMKLISWKEGEHISESMFDLIDELDGGLRACLREKNERNISFLDRESQDILDRIDDKWVYQEDMFSSMKKASDALDDMDMDKLDSETIDLDVDNPLVRWTDPQNLQKDIESYTGKKLEDFEYSDKLDAYNWVKDNCEGFISDNPDYMEEYGEEGKEVVRMFLNELKEFFGL